MEEFSAIYIIIGVASLFGLWVLFYFIPVGLWFTALLSGVKISLLQLVFMRWRKVPPQVIVRNLIASTKADIMLKRNDLEAHYLAGGNVQNVVNALISADKANMEIDFKTATAIDLAGRDVLEAVQMSVNPKVIDTPPVTAVAKDGIQLICRARVTVRASIRQLIDIADIDIGKNIGAVLQMDQAEADKNIAQAKAEERRAMAVALEQEMKAKAQEARAEVIMAEKQIPKALSDALINGNIGVMDYYRMENIQSDTTMRKSISAPTGKKTPKTKNPDKDK